MCFSATASFTASALIVPTGVYGVFVASRKRQWRWVLLALVPVAFGIQQFIEGFVWKAVHRGDAAAAHTWGLGFLFFSHFFWPFYIPVLSFFLEENSERRRWLFRLAVVGLLFSLTIYLPFWFMEGWYHPSVIHNHITYQTVSVIPKAPAHIIYISIIMASLLGSSRRELRLFGILYAASIALTAVFWRYAFTSVWCYFAALLSAYLVYALRQLPAGPSK